MPIYEYLCESCGKVNEKLQKVTDPPPRQCDECGSRKLAKLVSRSAFQLKGGGWYSDLYASKKKDAKAAEGSDGATPSTPAEAKPAAKAEGKAEGAAAAPAPASAPKAEAPKAPAADGAGKKKKEAKAG